MKTEATSGFDLVRQRLSVGMGAELSPQAIELEPSSVADYHDPKPFFQWPFLPWFRRSKESPSLYIPPAASLTVRLDPSPEDDYRRDRPCQVLSPLKPRCPVFWEVVGTGEQVHIQVAVNPDDVAVDTSQLLAYYQEAAVFEADDLLGELDLRVARGYCLLRSHLLPLPEPGSGEEPYTPLLGVLGAMEPRDAGALQVGFIQATHPRGDRGCCEMEGVGRFLL